MQPAREERRAPSADLGVTSRAQSHLWQ